MIPIGDMLYDRLAYSAEAVQQEEAHSMIDKNEMATTIPPIRVSLPQEAPVASLQSARSTVEGEDPSAIDLPTVKTVRATVRYGGWLAPMPLDEDDFVEPCEDFPLIPLSWNCWRVHVPLAWTAAVRMKPTNDYCCFHRAMLRH